MRIASTAKLTLALICSWQTSYQICDRYGDAFKAVAALSASGGAAAIASPSEDLDASMPLTLGRTLLPGFQELTPRLEALDYFDRQCAITASIPRSIDLLGRSPPHQRYSVFDPPPKPLLLLSLAAAGSLAPPAV